MSRSSRSFLRIWHRPKLERLEPRLPPGDAMLGLLLAWPEAPLETSQLNDDRYAAVDSSMDLRAAGLIPAVHTAGINPAARNAGSSDTDESTSTQRAAGFIPAVYPAGINPAARNTIAAIASRFPGLPTPTRSPNADLASDAQHSDVLGNYGKLPLTFEANHGQTDAQVDFITRAGGDTVFLTPTAAVFAIQNSESRIQNSVSEPEALATRAALESVAYASGSEGSAGVAIHMQIVGANPNASPIGQQRQPGIVNYFIGNDPSQWHANIPTFGRVQYDDVYPGIDLAYYGGQSRDGHGAGLEYDFIVSPHADPNAITLNFAGADSVEINPQGDLVLHTAAGDVVQQAPFTYQETGQTRQEVSSRYVVDGTQVRFEVGAYDATRPLVIDPLVMGYSTYLGGGNGYEVPDGISVDESGNAYVTGGTTSTDFPTTPGAFDTSPSLNSDAFVAKLDSAGSALIYSTFLGGSSDESAPNIAVDEDRNAYVIGNTTSTDFPTTTSAFDTSHNGSWDVYVLKLNMDGSALLYSTFIGGSNYDFGNSVDVDSDGNAYVTGLTVSTNFPTTPGAFDEGYNGGNEAFLSKLDATGSDLIYCTYLGGLNSDAGFNIAADPAGNAYVVGIVSSADFPVTLGAFDTTYNGGIYDAFATKMNADGSTLIYSTYVGGGNSDYGDGAMALDTSGNVYFTGFTRSSTFPTTLGAFDSTYNGSDDGFVTKLNPDGSALVYSTFLGGPKSDFGEGIAVDAFGTAYVSGGAESRDFPTTPGAFDTTYNGGDYDAFLLKLDGSGSSLLYSTYLGGRNMDFTVSMTINGSGDTYLTGVSLSDNFPTTPGALRRRSPGGEYKGFVTKFVET